MYHQPDFYLGTAWYPEWEPAEEWRRDLVELKKTGLNTVRITEFSWEHLEPQPGQFNFSLYDQVMQACADQGIWVVLGIDTSRPPVWLFERYPDIHLVDQFGQKAPGTWPMHCFNHPGFIEASSRLIKNLVSRYKDSPALVYYQLDNEPAYHLRGSHLQKGTSIYCYCHNCQREFEIWLKKRYPNGFPFRYPKPLPEPELMGELLYMEWRRFHDETNVRRVDWIAKEVKRYDTVHPVTTNIMVGSRFSWGASHLAHDAYGLGKVLDVYGMDLYTDVRRDYQPRDAMTFSLSDRLGGSLGYHCLETQPTTSSVTKGGWGDQQMGFQKNGDDRRMIPWGWRPLAFGARSLLYWVWRLQWPNVWAIARPDGSVTEFGQQIQRLSREFKKAWPAITGSQLYPSQVAILHNQDTLHLAAHQKLGAVPGDSIYGAFIACWQNRILPDVLDERQLDEIELAKYRVVIAPYLSVTSAKLSQALRDYVAGGGTLIWDARSGAYGEDDGGFKEYSGASNWSLNCWHVPANHFQEVVGYRSLMIYGTEKPELTLDGDFGGLKAGATFAGLNWWDEWEPAEDATVLARFGDGKPALIQHHFGAGQTFAFATDLFRAVAKGETRNIELVQALLQGAGVTPWVKVTGLPADLDHQFEVVLRTKGEKTYLFALNASPAQVAPQIALPVHFAKAKDVLKDRAASLQVDQLSLSLEPYEVAVIELSS